MKGLLIGLTVIFSVLGQLILKFGENTLYWPAQFSLVEIGRLIWYSALNWYVIASLFSMLIASIMWVLVVQVVPLSRAYPFMSLNYVLVYIVSLFMFGERLDIYSVIGTVFIVAGTACIGYGFSK